MNREVSRENSNDATEKGAVRPDQPHAEPKVWRIHITGPHGAECQTTVPSDSKSADLIQAAVGALERVAEQVIEADATPSASGAGTQPRKSPGRKG